MLKQLLVLLLLLGFAPLMAEEGDPPNKLKSTQIGQLNGTMQLQLNSALANLEQSLMASAANASMVDGMQDLQEQVSWAVDVVTQKEMIIEFKEFDNHSKSELQLLAELKK